MTRPVRVRIAPSPTGNLHVGTARAALFNYLFARHHNGSFILRVEDTDKARSLPEYEQNIYDGLRALGLQWDEGPDVGGDYGPYRQSERSEHYTNAAMALLKAGLAYYTDDTDAELEAQRNAAKAAGKPYVYRQHREATNGSLRFRIPTPYTTLVLNDAVRGHVSFDTELLGDFVILKSDGCPTYNFANVVDDSAMAISHVIRGEDHISNTPRQLLMYDALRAIGYSDAPTPEFAHASMILAPDRSKLSKRFGATAVADYMTQGYLPEAFCNFLALLGWSPPDGNEFGTLEELAKKFTLDRISKSPAIFETDKLNFFNKHYIKELNTDTLYERVSPYIDLMALGMEYTPEQQALLLEAIREPLVTLTDVTEATPYFFGQDVEIPEALKADVLNTPDAATVLHAFANQWPTWDKTSPDTIGAELKALMKSLKPLKPKNIMWPIRTATTGRTSGADLATTLYLLDTGLLGNNRVAHRVQQALAHCPMTSTT